MANPIKQTTDNCYFMLKLTPIIFFFFLCHSVYAQDTLTTYLDDKWKKTSEEEATYFKKSFKTGDKWVAHFYQRSGELRMIGNYKKKKTKKGNGTFTYFYDNGQKEKQVDFIKKKREGTYHGWYKSGEKLGTGNYQDD